MKAKHESTCPCGIVVRVGDHVFVDDRHRMWHVSCVNRVLRSVEARVVGPVTVQRQKTQDEIHLDRMMEAL